MYKGGGGIVHPCMYRQPPLAALWDKNHFLSECQDTMFSNKDKLIEIYLINIKAGGGCVIYTIFKNKLCFSSQSAQGVRLLNGLFVFYTLGGSILCLKKLQVLGLIPLRGRPSLLKAAPSAWATHTKMSSIS